LSTAASIALPRAGKGQKRRLPWERSSPQPLRLAELVARGGQNRDLGDDRLCGDEERDVDAGRDDDPASRVERKAAADEVDEL